MKIPHPTKRNLVHITWFLLVECLVVYTLIQWISIIASTGRHPGGDGPHILGTATRLAQLLFDGEWTLFVVCFSSLLGPHPPFAYVPFMGVELFTGGSTETSHLWAGALVVWLCWDGIRRLGGSVWGYFWMVSLTPIWLQAEIAGIDLVAAVTVVQSVSHLAKSEGLKHRWHVFGWGAWMGAAFMTKYTAPMFLWAPCLVTGLWILRYQRWDRLILGFLSFLIVALPWWSTHYKNVYGYVMASGDGSSGLLTNKVIIEGPWYIWENISWYPAAIADAMGWGMIVLTCIAIVCTRMKVFMWSICLSSFLGGWFMLNAQKQRQDRYIIPAYPVMAAMVGHSWMALPSLYYSYKNIIETQKLYSYKGPTPAQRDYEHHIDTAGVNWPTPSVSYWPINQNPNKWGVDDMLKEVRKYHGSSEGTVGFLLEEEGGAPGYGMILRRATALGYRWHIATVMVVQPGGSQMNDPNRPLASVFVGPFLFGEWPSRDFDTLLVVQRRPHNDWENYILSTKMKLQKSFKLPQNRKARIYQKK